MKTFLAKVVISILADEEKRKYVIMLLLAPIIFLFLIFVILPTVILGVLTSTPMVEDSQIIDMYIPVVEEVENLTFPTVHTSPSNWGNCDEASDYIENKLESLPNQEGVKVDAAYLLAIDAIKLEQNFENASITNIKSMAWRFTKEVNEEYSRTFLCGYDSEGNPIYRTYNIEWTYYEEVPIDSVLNELRAENKITSDELEDIKMMVEMMKSAELEIELGEYEPTIEGSNGWLWVTPSTRITSPFGPRVSPVPGASTFHKGVDVGAVNAGVAGDPIWAMADGKVVISSYGLNAGHNITIEHDNGIRSRYLHLHTRGVRVGDTVTRGQVIGRMGNTGIGSGVHLHFEIHLNGKEVNPLAYFNL